MYYVKSEIKFQKLQLSYLQQCFNFIIVMHVYWLSNGISIVSLALLIAEL